MNQEHASYGLLAEFEHEEALVAAVRRTRESGYVAVDAFSPYPIDDLEDALRLPKTRVPLIVLIGGLTGACTAYLMQWYANVVSYPLNIGGRPHHSWPAFIPITFELTVLFAALFGVIGMLVLNRLPQPYHPVFNIPQFVRASQDAFFLCIESNDPLFRPDATRQFLAELQPSGVWEVPW
jgi:hypothetical protein